jgi:hypothetical protein
MNPLATPIPDLSAALTDGWRLVALALAALMFGYLCQIGMSWVARLDPRDAQVISLLGAAVGVGATIMLSGFLIGLGAMLVVLGLLGIFTIPIFIGVMARFLRSSRTRQVGDPLWLPEGGKVRSDV